MRPSNILKHIILIPIKAYQYFISPILGPNCRYLPTCSDYCRQAVEKHGIAKGILLSSRRILKCNPFAGFGFDPVPERFSIIRNRVDE